MKKVLLVLLSSLLFVACVSKSEFEKAQAENSNLRAQIAELQSKLSEAKSELERKPAMPVKVTFRQALLGPGFVAVFNTTIKQDFPVLVTVKSKALGISQKFKLRLSYVATSELGHSEGVTIEAGDEVIVENNNYEPLVVVFSP
ncbi:MAG: hypothetical protein HY807_01845 [Nitrospirae bacterium]|nr:hypothetical protein [Nitrospirota bacterium]